ncbi:ferrous iron transporter B [Mycobacterium sp. CVI_P3]|uniref:Ferrous iron transporter B n=1 Tax=Mycobacterium pinniadriaticum TaxID=2994102 RepID=A0ABT3SKG7_9MYCO|nr:ferrous iron transporter B [Mycobacterium pinniadriaticum]MCX2933217.1 ferrous iron transporter B [Mycobacterium pinniadriaticum]MCX2939639.1 ferrous iron transporter B [Mycobacterium pinniadriaticum]
MSGHHHGGGAAAVNVGLPRFAVVGSPNSGKTTLFNAMTGLHAKTGNYPGVTVARFEGRMRLSEHETVVVEDLPGTYSLDPISPDEQIVVDVLDTDHHNTRVDVPDALLVLLNATTLRRSLGLLAQLLQTGLPTCVVLTFTDDLARRHGTLDVAALSKALGVPIIPVVGGHRDGVERLRATMADVKSWSSPVVLPPTDTDEVTGWVDSVLATAGYRVPDLDHRTRRIDAVLLHPVAGTVVFLLTMFVFFQTIFTVAAPLQDYVAQFFGWLGDLVTTYVHVSWLSAFLSEAVIGGVGSVLVFVPQIALLFILIALLEGTGYLARAAFLMDRVMARAGLEGRAFVALLSSVACAIPGIMATRSLPSAKDRLATMMGAPLMTCSARLPVYILLISMLLSADSRVGPFSARGVLMFVLYLLGAVSAMVVAAIFKRFTSRRAALLPFYMEMPPYQVPRLRTVIAEVWTAASAFLRKVSSIILATTVILWILLNLPVRHEAEMTAAGVDTSDHSAVSSYVLDHSYGASVGRAIEPVFAPLGFDWRINIGVLSSLAARETFVATLGQVAAAQDPEDPTESLRSMRVQSGPDAGRLLFDAPTIAALLVFFMFALQCMSTVGVLRRETGSWKWPAIAWAYMFALAWVLALATRTIVATVW